MSVEQTLTSKVVKSKLPIDDGLWLALPCPNRAQELFGRQLLVVALSYTREHSCSCRAKTISYQHPRPQPGTA